MPCTPATILIVDDDELVAQSHRRALVRAGFRAIAVSSAAEALDLLRHGDDFDTIVTDIRMPNMSGITLLREIRKHNLDVPVILVTGQPTVETAAEAVRHGGFRYMTKPIEIDELTTATKEAISLYRLAQLKREALELFASQQRQLGDRASLEVHFEDALDRLWIAFQPIVDWQSRSVFGYEALLRSACPKLPTPDLILDAAERLDRVVELGRTIRKAIAARISALPADTTLFVNLHSRELEDPELLSPSSALAEHAAKIVLEITERNSLESIKNVPETIGQLRALGYRIAVDDLGAGYAGLSCFRQLEPDFAKLDMSLIRDIDTIDRQQSLVRSIVAVCTNDLAIKVVCEGVETRAELDTLAALGATLLQGYLFAKPSAEFVTPEFSDR